MNADRSAHAGGDDSDGHSNGDSDDDSSEGSTDAGGRAVGEDGGSDDRRDGDGGDRWLILNPVSGEGNHAGYVHRLAADRGLRVRETEGEGDTAAFAREAVEANVRDLLVCGGDGTIQEVLSGFAAVGAIRPGRTGEPDADDTDVGDTGATDIDAVDTDADTTDADTSAGNADTPDLPTLAVIPAGTANIFAEDIGITGIEGGFAAFDDGETRALDVGFADGEPFMKSCIAGLTADTSSATSDDLKERFGSLAFVITGIERAAEFDPLSVAVGAYGDGENTADVEVEAEKGGDDESEDDGEIEAEEGSEAQGESESEGEDGWSWRGEVLCLVVGNARRYAGRVGQANVEDGLLDVTLVEEMPPRNVVTEAIGRQLLGRETEHVTRLKARRIEIETTTDRSISFSLDGEIAEHDRLDVTIAERAVPVRVGPTYEPVPDDPDESEESSGSGNPDGAGGSTGSTDRTAP